MRFALSLAIAFMFVGAVFAQEVLYEEDFAEGTLSLNWFSVWANGENIVASANSSAPDEDGYVGYLGNSGSGGGVGTACFGTLDMEDYSYTAWVKTTVGTSSYNGIVARMDTTGGTLSYYSFRSDFDSDARLQLVKYPGSGYGADVVRNWTSEEIPGGFPTADSWHKFRLELDGNQISVFYDDTEMTDSPFTVSGERYLSSGVPGVYIFNMTATTATEVDSIVVNSIADAAVEAQETVILPVSAEIVSTYPNPFNPETTISFRADNSVASLAVFDVLGRQVATLVDNQYTNGVTRVSWNAGAQPAGTYFIVLKKWGSAGCKQGYVAEIAWKICYI